MNKKKSIILCILTVLLIALIATAVVLRIQHNNEMERLRIYNETYLVVDGIEYRRDSVELDLSGQTITEFSKLQELTALQHLNLRDTGITVQQFDALRAALPECEILWSVPFQGSYCDSTSQELVLDSLTIDDLAILAYLPALTSIHADFCRDYDELFTLMEQYPNISVTYTVPIGGNNISPAEETITVTEPNTAELLLQIPRLPNLKTVTLEGSLPSNEELLEMKKMAEDADLMLTAGYGPNASENLASSDPEVVKNEKRLPSYHFCMDFQRTRC